MDVTWGGRAAKGLEVGLAFWFFAWEGLLVLGDDWIL